MSLGVPQDRHSDVHRTETTSPGDDARAIQAEEGNDSQAAVAETGMASPHMDEEVVDDNQPELARRVRFSPSAGTHESLRVAAGLAAAAAQEQAQQAALASVVEPRPQKARKGPLAAGGLLFAAQHASHGAEAAPKWADAARWWAHNR